MAAEQDRPKPRFLPFWIALILACALIVSGWGVLTANAGCLLGSAFLAWIVAWSWVNAGQDLLRRARLVLCLSIALVTARGWWEILPGNWLVLIAFVSTATLVSYLFLREFLGSIVEILWAFSLSVHTTSTHLNIWQTLLYTRVPLTDFLIWRIIIRKLRQAGTVETAQLLASAVSDHPDPQTRQQALQALDGLTDQAAIDAVCAVWAATRHPDLRELLLRKKWRAANPPEALVFSALLIGEIDALCKNLNDVDSRREGKALIKSLVQACLDTDPVIVERAGQVLRRLENVDAKEALCQAVVEQENPPAAAVALSTGYLPKGDQKRALFLFMTAQWERYASHDFDRRLMHLAYLNSEEPLRQRIREKLRAAGRIDFLPIIAGEGSGERVTHLNTSESEVLVQTLAANRDWAALWRHVPDLPFQWSVRAMDALVKSGWKPASDEQQIFFAELAGLMTDDLLMKPAELQELFPPAFMQATARVPGRINAVAFAPSHPTLAIGTGQKRVVLWNYQTAQRERGLRNFEHSVGEVAFSTDGTLFCAEHTNGSAACSIHVFPNVWKTDTSFRLGTHTGSVTALVPLSGARLLSAGNDGNVVLWDLSTRKEMRRSTVYDWARNLHVSHDETQILLLRRGFELLSLPDLQTVGRAANSTVLRCGAFAPDGQSMFIGAPSGQLLIYRKNSKKSFFPATRKELLTKYDPTERVEAIEVLERLSLLVSVGTGGEARFFSLEGHKQIGSINIPGGKITSLNISPDEFFLAVGSAEATLTLWDLRSLNVRIMLEQPFSQATLGIVSAIGALLEHTHLVTRARQVLQFAQIVLRHRFRYAIEIEETPSIALGEFDIEID